MDWILKIIDEMLEEDEVEDWPEPIRTNGLTKRDNNGKKNISL